MIRISAVQQRQCQLLRTSIPLRHTTEIDGNHSNPNHKILTKCTIPTPSTPSRRLRLTLIHRRILASTTKRSRSVKSDGRRIDRDIRVFGLFCYISFFGLFIYSFSLLFCIVTHLVSYSLFATK